MWVPFFCLLLGFLLSRYLNRCSGPVMFYSLLILLFLLGFKIGSQPQIFASIPRLGLKAVAFFLIVSFVTLLFAYVLEQHFHRPRQGEEEPVDLHGEEKAELKFTLAVSAFLFGGIICGRLFPVSLTLIEHLIDYVLWLIFISVGMGMREGIKGIVENRRIWIFIILPFVFLAGSLAGGAVASFVLRIPMRYALAIAGGMGYYSVTAPLVTQTAGADIGFIAFLSNFFREILTFFLASFLIRLSKLSPLALGGATTMDTTLVVIRRYCGEDLALAGFASGVILTLVVPVFELFILM